MSTTTTDTTSPPRPESVMWTPDYVHQVDHPWCWGNVGELHVDDDGYILTKTAKQREAARATLHQMLTYGPERLDMRTWASLRFHEEDLPDYVRGPADDDDLLDLDIYGRSWQDATPMCGTTQCLAGHAVLANGYQFLFKGSGFSTTDTTPDGFNPGEYTVDTSRCVKAGSDPDQESEDVSSTAKALLGLTYHEGEVFGVTSATYEDIVRVVYQWSLGRHCQLVVSDRPGIAYDLMIARVEPQVTTVWTTGHHVPA